MASPARPASVSGPFGLAPDLARCSFDQTLRREDYPDNRLLRSLVSMRGQENYSKEIITEAIENCMKKQAENLVNSLDVISGRLSQLELYCYKLERSIGELRSDVMDYHGEANVNFSGLEKHVKEVQKSVQVLQDKQELAETQNELAKLQIVYEDPAQKSEGTAPSVFMAKENNGSFPGAKHELALVPLHHVNAMQFQSCNGLILQQLVPVSLSNQQDQQHLNQSTVYCAQNQSHPEHRQAQTFQPTPQSVQQQAQNLQNLQPQNVVEVPPITSQAPGFYLQAQHQWAQQTVQDVHSQARQPEPQMGQQQQYHNIQQVPAQRVQLQTSSPQAQSAPQVTLFYPPYGSQQPACGNTEALTRGMVVQPCYSTISSSQRKHHEAAPIYVQSSAISVPMAEHNLQHQQLQPQQFHSPGNGSFAPQPSKVGLRGVSPYSVQGSAQAYNTVYGSPPNNAAATFVAVLPQQAQVSAPMMLHHLGPQGVQSHPVDMADKAARMGYQNDHVENMPLRMVTAGHPVEFNAFHDGLSSVGNAAWSG